MWLIFILLLWHRQINWAIWDLLQLYVLWGIKNYRAVVHRNHKDHWLRSNGKLVYGRSACETERRASKACSPISRLAPAGCTLCCTQRRAKLKLDKWTFSSFLCAKSLIFCHRRNPLMFSLKDFHIGLADIGAFQQIISYINDNFL